MSIVHFSDFRSVEKSFKNSEDFLGFIRIKIYRHACNFERTMKKSKER